MKHPCLLSLFLQANIKDGLTVEVQSEGKVFETFYHIQTLLFYRRELVWNRKWSETTRAISELGCKLGISVRQKTEDQKGTLNQVFLLPFCTLPFLAKPCIMWMICECQLALICFCITSLLPSLTVYYGQTLNSTLINF